MSKIVSWCFTINNYTDADIAACDSVVQRCRTCNYLCYGLEIAPSTGTPHVQGYVQFTGQGKRRTAVQTLLGGRSSLTPCTGSDEENQKYCAKTREQDETPNEVFMEFGTRRTIRGKKKQKGDDFKAIKDAIVNGKSLRDVASDFPEQFIKHSSGISSMVKLLGKQPTLIRYGPFRWSLPDNFKWETCLLVVGATGVGKTQWAKTLFPNPLLVSHIDQLRGFNPNHHGGIIFDDMTFAHMPRTACIHLTDIDEERAIHVRYGIATIPAGTKKVFTSNVPFSSVFVEDPAIRRRVTTLTL